MHSTASDGTDRPEALAKLAKNAGLGAIALTDHDTTEGLSACERACRRAGVGFVPGIEISADPRAVLPATRAPAPQAQFGTLHILGFFVRHDDPRLAEIHERMRTARNERNPAIVARLQALGLQIQYEEVLELARNQGTAIIGRPHIAQVLIKKGYVKSIQDAFGKYLGQGRAAYVRRDRLNPAEALDAIHHAGGLGVLAHPVQLKCRDLEQVEHFTARLRALGLDGIETRHSDHGTQFTAQLEALADRLGLLTTGGSDYHGSRKSVELGSQEVPLEVYERLREAWEKGRM